MASSTTSLKSNTRLEDVLAYLPLSRTTDYSAGQRIYGPYDLPTNIYLVLTGKVGVSLIAEDGSEVLLEIVRPDELFGESAFLGLSRRSERATAIEKATLMTWTVSDLEDLVVKRPRLGVALLQVLAQRNADFRRQIESFALDTIERRLARSLIRFSERLGAPEENGSVRMMPLTHLMLARHIGTSREIVTQHMSRFRRQGYLSYSRDGILLYRETLKTLLGECGVSPAETSS